MSFLYYHLCLKAFEKQEKHSTTSAWPCIMLYYMPLCRKILHMKTFTIWYHKLCMQCAVFRHFHLEHVVVLLGLVKNFKCSFFPKEKTLVRQRVFGHFFRVWKKKGRRPGKPNFSIMVDFLQIKRDCSLNSFSVSADGEENYFRSAKLNCLEAILTFS